MIPGVVGRSLNKYTIVGIGKGLYRNFKNTIMEMGDRVCSYIYVIYIEYNYLHVSSIINNSLFNMFYTGFRLFCSVMCTKLV